MMRLGALLLVAGCFKSFAPMPPQATSPLPERSDQFVASSNRPRAALTTHVQFDRAFRANVRNYGELNGVNGVDQLRYPETNHPDAALAYIRIGNATFAAGFHGSAAQSFWAALGVTSKTLGSRRQREELRQATYLGLSDVAKAKQQYEWAALLELCAGLAATYISSEIAVEHHDEFYSALETQLRTQREAEAAEARARRGLLMQRIASGVSMATTVAAGAAGVMSQSQVNAQAAQIGSQLATADQQERELMEQMKQAMGAISASVGQLREVAASDVPAIQAGRAFVARQVGWYLLAAKDPLRYFDGPLATYARGRPALRRAVETARGVFAAHASDETPSDVKLQAIASLALAVVAVERHVAMHERNRIVPPPDYVTSVCGPSGGAIECFMSATDLCRAGIEEGCLLLTTIVAGGAP